MDFRSDRSDTPMTCLLDLDDLAYDLIFSHLRYLDLYHLSISCRTLRTIVGQSSLKTLNCTRSTDLPVNRLPYPTEHHLYGASDWRNLKKNKGIHKEDLYMSNLYWTSRHKHFNLSSLTSLFLDGSRVNVLDIIHFITVAPRLNHLSIRFCTQVNRLLLQNYLGHLSEHRQLVNLKQFDVVGIDGIPFFEPPNNGRYIFNEMEIELIGAGPEYDYNDLWRERMYDFKMSLERVPTTHGANIRTDIARCSQSYCRNFNLGRKELADPTALLTLSACFLCRQKWTEPICRPCISSRSCNLCDTFICPSCNTHIQ